MTGSVGPRRRELILTLSCPDRPGIVARTAGLIADRGGNILDSHQFGDPDAATFFMRIHFAIEGDPAALASWRAHLEPVAADFGMTWELHDAAHRPRMLVLVSREGHCLNDLLYRVSTGAVRADVVAVASATGDMASLAARHGVPFHRLPDGTDAAELDGALLELVDREAAELVVLARFMRILGPAACSALAGRAINIHHSFLPSFKGAAPYRQAHDRGVKLIGATAHYVTEELDDGPIIEQEVARVDHSHSVAELARVGRDVECVALARAVRWHVEHRVLLHGDRTVVFR